MPAYVVTQIEIHDPVLYEDYRKISTASIQSYGGRFVVRGAPCETLEGTWLPKRLVIVEFPSLEIAKKWWNSPEYAPGKKIRQETAHTEMLVVEGV